MHDARLALSSADLHFVKGIFNHFIPDIPVYAFGSRVRGKSRAASDLDLIIENKKPLDPKLRADLNEAFSESSLSFKVDLVERASTKKDFLKQIDRDKIRLQ